MAQAIADSPRTINDVVLEATNLTLRFGGVTALNSVSLTINDDQLLAVIGPNGAGKTSLLNSLCGFYRPQEGEIKFLGDSILGQAPHLIANNGLIRTFQGTNIFSGMTVLDNILVGRHYHMKAGLLKSFCYYPWAHKEELKHREFVEEIIDFLEIESIRHETVGSLGYGLRKRVDLARALAMEPKVLLMDEPMAGMNTEEKEDLARFILDIREAQKIPIVIVEHDMGVVMDIADQIAVLDFGSKIGEGSPEDIQKDDAVISAYLGGH